MRHLSFVALCLLALTVLSTAQKKIESKWNCSKPSQNQSFDVGDMPDHSYTLAQGTCTAASSSDGEKSGQYTEFQDVWKTKFTGHGRFVVTTDNGDKIVYNYTSSGPADTKKPSANKWNIVEGTGKRKGMKASGSCTGDRHDDGSADFTCNGMTMASK